MSFDFGDRLIEIAALTTIVGATTVEPLALGTRGAGGLPWAAMSSFGCFYLIKACITAAMPSWLRESCGVNSSHCSSILGMYSALSERSMLKVAPSCPVGISVQHATGSSKPSVYSIYALDEYTTGIVESCPSFQCNNQRPRIFTYKSSKPQNQAGDWVAIACTLVKLMETLVLWTRVGWQLSLASTGSWAFFFVAAIVLQVYGISREYNYSPETPTCDIILGGLPTTYSPEKRPKIIFGAPTNIRRHPLWLFTWVVGGSVSISTIVGIHVILNKGTAKQFYLWMGFQCLWLLLRILFYHFAVATDARHHLVVERRVPNQSDRLLDLASGVSRHFAQRHRRGSESYLHDVHDLRDIRSYVRSDNTGLTWHDVSCKGETLGQSGPEESHPGREFVNIDILAVVGDTVLSSIAWIHGCKTSSEDLYDSCLVVLKIQGKTRCVPSARVLSKDAKTANDPPVDPEAGARPRFVPRYDPGRGENNGWAYWIPMGGDQWLHFVCGMEFLGTQRAEVLETLEVSRQLMLGRLGISLRRVDEVMAQVQRATLVWQILLLYYSESEKHDGFVRVARPRFPP